MNSSLTIIINAHKEGALLYPTVKSAVDSLNSLLSNVHVEANVLFYLDNPDEETLEVVHGITKNLSISNCVEIASNGDPGASRMDAVRKTDSDYIAFLDGDDLWSENWLTLCYEFLIEKSFPQNIILHPEYNYIFGRESLFVRQGTCRNKPLSKEELGFFRSANYWDALCLTSRALLLQNPIPRNDKKNGYAHEDYLWNCRTSLSDIEHLNIPKTIHFKRRRISSVSSLANSNFERVEPTQLSRYSYYLN